jgi:hypothetical protein
MWITVEMTDWGWKTGFFSQNPALSVRDLVGNMKVMRLKSLSGTVLGCTFDWIPPPACTGLLSKPVKKFWFLGNYWRKSKVWSGTVYLKEIAAQFQPHCGRSNSPAIDSAQGPVQLLNLESILPLKMVSVYLPAIVLIMTSHTDGHYGKLANV